MASTKASDSTPATDKAAIEARERPGATPEPKLAAVRNSAKVKAPVAAKTEVKRPAPGRSNGKAVESPTVRQTKTEIVLRKLRSTKGVSIAQMMAATNWQAHSVRGFLSAVVRAKLGLALVSEIGRDGTRLYRVDDEASRPE
jgi:hypothetical protein